MVLAIFLRLRKIQINIFYLAGKKRNPIKAVMVNAVCPVYTPLKWKQKSRAIESHSYLDGKLTQTKLFKGTNSTHEPGFPEKIHHPVAPHPSWVLTGAVCAAVCMTEAQPQYLFNSTIHPATNPHPWKYRLNWNINHTVVSWTNLMFKCSLLVSPSLLEREQSQNFFKFFRARFFKTSTV